MELRPGLLLQKLHSFASRSERSQVYFQTRHLHLKYMCVCVCKLRSLGKHLEDFLAFMSKCWHFKSYVLLFDLIVILIFMSALMDSLFLSSLFLPMPLTDGCANR